MTGNRRTYRSTGSLAVTGLSNHDNIRILTHQGTQSHIKRQTRNRIYLRLIDSRKILLHRIFNGRNIDISAGEIIQHHIQRGRFSTSGRSGNINNSIRMVQHRCKLVITVVIHTKMIRMIHMRGCCHNTQNRLFTKYCWQNRYTDIDTSAL